MGNDGDSTICTVGLYQAIHLYVCIWQNLSLSNSMTLAVARMSTGNSKIFAMVLISLNFAYAAKFCENKTLAKWLEHSVIYCYR